MIKVTYSFEHGQMIKIDNWKQTNSTNIVKGAYVPSTMSNGTYVPSTMLKGTYVPSTLSEGTPSKLQQQYFIFSTYY